MRDLKAHVSLTNVLGSMTLNLVANQQLRKYRELVAQMNSSLINYNQYVNTEITDKTSVVAKNHLHQN